MSVDLSPISRLAGRDRRRGAALLGILLGWSLTAAAAPALPGNVPPFLRTHCGDCHAGDAAAGGFSIDAILQPADRPAAGLDPRPYEAIHRQLSRGRMPPAEAPQPTADDRRAVLASLNTFLDGMIDDRGPRAAGSFARRLNREELQNDLFDTLGIDRTLYNLRPFAELLPEEGRVDGFDTVGAGLGQSPLLLEEYRQAVDAHLAMVANDHRPQRWRFKFGHRYLDPEQAIYEGLGHRVFVHEHRGNAAQGEPPPPPRLNGSVPAFDMTWQLAGEAAFPWRSEAAAEAAARSFFGNFGTDRRRRHGRLQLTRDGGLPVVDEDSLTIADRLGMVIDDGPPLVVAAPGRYTVRIRCRLRFTAGVEPAAVSVRYFNRSHFFAGRFDRRDLADVPTYRLDEDAPRPCFENPDRGLTVPPGEWVVLEFDDVRTPAEIRNETTAGLTFDFRFVSRVPAKTREAPSERPWRDGRPAARPTLAEIEAHHPFLVDVDYLEVEGPHSLVADPAALIPTGPAAGADARTTARDCLARLLPRLYRSPAEEGDLETVLGIFDRTLSRTGDFRESLRTAICAAYLSPRHLFVANTPARRQPGRPMSAHELATRLSLFLWSSTPDAELLAAADRGTLSDPAILRRQARRLLDHPYASELTANFASQWLGLHRIGLNEPDDELYDYDQDLEQAMVNETLRFFHEVLRTDGSIRLFLDSDWVMVNDRLAGMYDYRFAGPPDGRPFSSWRKVSVAALGPRAGVRGGLLGQPAILKLTSGSIRTSIVGRGMFILEKILDDPPPPPPENVGEIANAVADLDQKSVREQLEIHRLRATCNACHQRIDPLGFALENYGAIGQWRLTETDGMRPIIVEEIVSSPDGNQVKTTKVRRQGHPVDTRGVVMGVPVDGPRALRELLLTKDDVFARCLVGKLLVYALGRSLRHQDQAVIDAIVATTAGRGYRLRDIVEAIVMSESFRTY